MIGTCSCFTSPYTVHELLNTICAPHGRVGLLSDEWQTAGCQSDLSCRWLLLLAVRGPHVFAVVLAHGLYEVDGAHHVVRVVQHGLGHALAHCLAASKVHHHVKPAQQLSLHVPADLPPVLLSDLSDRQQQLLPASGTHLPEANALSTWSKWRRSACTQPKSEPMVRCRQWRAATREASPP